MTLSSVGNETARGSAGQAGPRARRGGGGMQAGRQLARKAGRQAGRDLLDCLVPGDHRLARVLPFAKR
jgi:hypothetical protein